MFQIYRIVQRERIFWNLQEKSVGVLLKCGRKLKNPIYPVGVLLTSKVMKSDEPKKIAEKEAIPEFRRFNIIENEVRNVV